MNLLRDNWLKKVAKWVKFCWVKQRSSGLFRICNPIISLRHFYSIFAWFCIEICGLIIWLVVRKNTQYQALSAFYGEIRRYETGRFALDTKFHFYISFISKALRGKMAFVVPILHQSRYNSIQYYTISTRDLQYLKFKFKIFLT